MNQYDFDTHVLTPDYLADPYRYYHALRKAAPVFWSERLNAWVLTRYGDVQAALRDKRLISGKRVSTYADGLPVEQLKPLYDQMDKWIGNMDPPDHTRLRRLVNVAFTPRMVESLRPRIARLVDELLDQAEEQGVADFIATVAYPLPAIVIAEMLGVPARHGQEFMAWSDALTAYAGTGQADLEIARKASRGAAQLTSLLEELMIERRNAPRDDLISALVEAEEEGDRLSEQELLSMCGFLLVAGHETTMSLLGNGMMALLRHREAFEQLRSHPGLIASAVEEFLRYDSPIQHQTRVAAEDFELSGRSIKAGQRVMPFLGAANRDPEQFPDPDRLDLERNPNKHLAFGYGPHFCVGAPLARLEASIAFGVIVDRFPGMQLEAADIKWRFHTSNRSPVALSIRLT
jgi:hypothetical protein